MKDLSSKQQAKKVARAIDRVGISSKIRWLDPYHPRTFSYLSWVHRQPSVTLVPTWLDLHLLTSLAPVNQPQPQRIVSRYHMSMGSISAPSTEMLGLSQIAPSSCRIPKDMPMSLLVLGCMSPLSRLEPPKLWRMIPLRDLVGPCRSWVDWG